MPLARLLLMLTVLTLSVSAFPGALSAQIMVEVVNQTASPAHVCFSYHDAISDSRITRGWWPVPPYSTVDIRVNATKPDLAWYAYNDKNKSWGGAENSPETERRHVVLENFLVKEGWKPRGKQHRIIHMKKERAGGGRLRLVLSPR